MAKSGNHKSNKTPETLAKEEMLEKLYDNVRIERASLEPADAPPASAERATEIARMPEFGYLEFYELTGIDQGRYSTFIVSDEGIRPTLDPNEAGLSARERLVISQITDGLSLAFPCRPSDFADWYHLTRAANGVSDFPLAQGFLSTLRRQTLPSGVHGDHAVPSDAIIAAFAVEPDSASNYAWWDKRLRGAKKHQGLHDARAQVGAASRMSTWYPRLIGLWLIEKGHMSRASVIAALTSNFPDCDLDWV
jgi:hypothetical protein